jgi:hypothetical protein
MTEHNIVFGLLCLIGFFVGAALGYFLGWIGVLIAFFFGFSLGMGFGWFEDKMEREGRW